MLSAKKIATKLLAEAGITINGDGPADIVVHNEKLYRRVLRKGSLGLGESYMDGWWDANNLDVFFDTLFSSRVIDAHMEKLHPVLLKLQGTLLNLQSKRRSFQVGEEHYDLGNDLYRAMLDPRMVYTCAYWRGVDTLAEAQEQKLDLVCKKIGLKKGDRVLDVGGGWGSFAKFAAEKYGARVVAITVSKEQAELGRENTKGLDVEIRVQDFRDVSDGPYDHIVSLGMFEHVGVKNYKVYMEKMRELLSDEGLFLLHTIGNNISSIVGDSWIDKYIFPNGVLPSIKQIGASLEKVFVMEDWQNFGTDYDKTLMAWHSNFEKEWPQLKEKYGERFRRMWRYYLLLSAALFRSRRTQLWQIVLSKNGLREGYTNRLHEALCSIKK